MSGSLIQALIFVIDVFAGLYLLLLLLRFLIPWLRIDFRDPLAQGVLKLTSPVVIPVRRFLPAIGRVDTATIVVAFVIQYLVVMIITVLVGAPVVSALAIAVQYFYFRHPDFDHPQLDCAKLLQSGGRHRQGDCRTCPAALQARYPADGRF